MQCQQVLELDIVSFSNYEALKLVTITHHETGLVREVGPLVKGNIKVSLKKKEVKFV